MFEANFAVALDKWSRFVRKGPAFVCMKLECMACLELILGLRADV